MRTTLIAFALLLLAVASYAYKKNPAGCAKVGTDLVAIFQSLTATSVAPGQSAVPSDASEPAAAVPAAKPAPAPASSPTPAQASASTAAHPSPAPVKPWTPPNVMPAQPNWTWTTWDGKTYQNVVVTKVEPETVTITHSMGVAHITISTLPPDIQKQLNYDPEAAAAAKVERDRESAHPYYLMASLAEAQRVARRLHWPLAWICSDLAALEISDPPAGSVDDLTQMAVNDLKSHAVIIFLNGNDDLWALSPIIRDQQLFQLDDGPLPDGHHFYGPKIVFSDANVTKAFGRVSHTQMVASREAAIDAVLQSIANDPVSKALLNGQSASAPALPSSSPTPAAVPGTPP